MCGKANMVGSRLLCLCEACFIRVRECIGEGNGENAFVWESDVCVDVLDGKIIADGCGKGDSFAFQLGGWANVKCVDSWRGKIYGEGDCFSVGIFIRVFCREYGAIDAA